MKVKRPLKIIFYLSFSALYVSGALDFILGRILPQTFGPAPAQALSLRVHGIAGLWFLFLFGHIFHAHVWPSYRRPRHRRSGVLLWITLGVLSVSVPFLYYLSNEKWRNATVLIHTYLGLLVIAPLFVHIGTAVFERRRIRRSMREISVTVQ